jgi:hypothetical protein
LVRVVGDIKICKTSTVGQCKKLMKNAKLITLFCGRLAGAPDKISFLKDGMNIVDVLAIMPYFLSLFLLDSDSL